jgi:hypothetical protein
MTPHPEQTRKCSNCMWWKPIITVRGEQGECVGGPPFRDFQWPLTSSANWCGSFRMKEPGQ